MKVRGSVRRLCEHCYIVRRRGKLYNYCKKVPKHKQRQLYHTDSGGAGGATCIDCHASASAAMSYTMRLPPTQPGLMPLLAQRQTACLGELYWRASSMGEW